MWRGAVHRGEATRCGGGLHSDQVRRGVRVEGEEQAGDEEFAG